MWYWKELSSSRYAISFVPIKAGDIYIDMAFIALDGDCLESSAGFCHDFGDEQIGQYLSNKKQTSSDSAAAEDSDDNSSVSLNDYMSTSVLKYLNIRTP